MDLYFVVEGLWVVLVKGGFLSICPSLVLFLFSLSFIIDVDIEIEMDIDMDMDIYNLPNAQYLIP